jgi:hypothetical protein
LRLHRRALHRQRLRRRNVGVARGEVGGRLQQAKLGVLQLPAQRWPRFKKAFVHSRRFVTQRYCCVTERILKAYYPIDKLLLQYYSYGCSLGKIMGKMSNPARQIRKIRSDLRICTHRIEKSNIDHGQRAARPHGRV